MILLLLFFIFVFLLVVGLILTGIGLTFKKKVNGFTIAGICITSIPIGYLIVIFLYSKIHNVDTPNHKEVDFSGTYIIVDDSGLLNKTNFKKYKLILKKNNTFKITPEPLLSVCQEGNIHSTAKDSSILIDCMEHHFTFDVKNELGYLRIGDSASRDIIYFKKVEK